jgi:6-phosphogluconolactonase
MSKIKSYPTAEETSKQLGGYLKSQINKSDIFHLAISGGSTPKMLFEALTAISDDIDWEKLHMYWVDERCVVPTHDESNFLMTYNSLLKHVPISENHIHRMKGELNSEGGLLDYQSNIASLPKKNGLPQFDLIILGMGDDGHTASIFPPEKELITVESDLAIGTNPYSGQKRLTLTGRTIKNATEIIFHVTGANKAKVLSEILNDKGNYINYPSYYFLGDKTTLYLDNKALGK